ncbi:MAG: glycosyltransferase family 39 protein, partial [Enterobacteriaceae bacterium]|nr:glycosyltransferase family 39 protein [Enterobacteriaceae bacterium]
MKNTSNKTNHENRKCIWKNYRNYFSKKNLILLIFVLAFLIRLAGVNQFLNNDETHSFRSLEKGEILDSMILNTPLSLIVIYPFLKIFGFQSWAIRLPLILTGITTLFLVYLISKRKYGMDSAFWATLIMALSFWHVEASLQIAYEGSFLTLFSILFIYFFIRYEESEKPIFILFSGLSVGLAVLSKINGFLILIPVFIYYLLKSKNIFKTTIIFLKISFIAFVLFLIYLFMTILNKSPSFLVSLYQMTNRSFVSGITSMHYPLLAIQYFNMFIFMTPLLLGFFIIWLIKYPGKNKLTAYVLIFFIFFYTFLITDNFRPIERYFMILIPILCVFGGKIISDNTKNKKEILISTLILFTLFFIFNYSKSKIIPFYPKEAFITQILTLNWNFFIPITGSSGPVGFYVPFLPLIIAFILSFILITIYLII